MNDYLSERLGEVRDVSDKVLLRELLETVIGEMFEESERKYEDLRSRIQEELPLEIGKYTIYSGLLDRAQLDGSHPFLFPMCPEDALPLPGLGLLLAKEAEGAGCVTSVFLKADTLRCRELAHENRIWKGTLCTAEGDISARFRLIPARRYLDCIRQLYTLFCFQSVPWVTLNAPYAFKMFDVELVDVQSASLSPEAQAAPIESLTLDCGKYTQFLKYDVFPVWNVQRRVIKGEGFPVPAQDKVNFEYQFDLADEGPEHGYLAFGGPDVIAARREAGRFIVTSPQEKGLEWELCKILQSKTYATDRPAYPVVSNRQEGSFAGQMAAHWGTVIKTRMELERLLLSYEASEHVKLHSYRIAWGSLSGESYECNEFIQDEIRDAGCTKTMLLEFRAAVRDDYLARDMVSFLTSQVQLIYPEYSCVGVLI